MYFTTNKNVLESNDLVELRQLDIITDSQGAQCVRMIYSLSPRKQYAGGEEPTHVHLTDGATHRMLTVTGTPFEEQRTDDPGSTQPNGQDSAGAAGGTKPKGTDPVGEAGGFQTGVETTPRQITPTATGQASLGNQPLRAPLDGSSTAIASAGMPFDPGSGDPTRLASPVPAIPGTGPTPELPILGSANGNPGNLAIPVVPGTLAGQAPTSAGSTPQPTTDDSGSTPQPTTDSGGVLQTGGSGEGATSPGTDRAAHGTADSTPALTSEDAAKAESTTEAESTTKTENGAPPSKTSDTAGASPVTPAPIVTPPPADVLGSTDTTHASPDNAHITDPLAGSAHETAATSSDPVAAPVNPSDALPPTTPTS